MKKFLVGVVAVVAGLYGLAPAWEAGGQAGSDFVVHSIFVLPPYLTQNLVSFVFYIPFTAITPFIGSETNYVKIQNIIYALSAILNGVVWAVACGSKAKDRLK